MDREKAVVLLNPKRRKEMMSIESLRVSIILMLLVMFLLVFYFPYQGYKYRKMCNELQELVEQYDKRLAQCVNELESWVRHCYYKELLKGDNNEDEI